MQKSFRWMIIFLMGVLFSLGCGMSDLLSDAPTTPAPAANVSAPTTAPIAARPPVPIAGLDAEETVLVNVYERVSPSVVFITVFGSDAGSGSGFVLDKEGHIVTNNHVVEGATRIRVKFSDDVDVEAKVTGRDPDTDLAVIEVKVPNELLKPVTLGDSNNLKVGQRALAIGNPFGFERALSVGFISALGRVVRLSSSSYSLPDLIQTDAAINPGNSGGPLLDAKGQVIGITTLIFSRSGVNSGVGFAIPVDVVKRVVPELIKSGHYSHPYLGISGESVNSDMADQLSLPVQRGVLITEVRPNGPAARAGLVAGNRNRTFNGRPIPVGGDIITAIDGVEVRSFDDIISYLAKSAKVGQSVELTIMRDGKPQKVKVTLGERPVQ
jgi:2-alkenal reductase